MSKTRIPASVLILKILSERLPHVQSILQKKGSDYQWMRDHIKKPVEFTADPYFQESSSLILFVQLLYVAAISMYGGIYCPVIYDVSEKENSVTFHWEKGDIIGFEWGIWSDSFVQMAKKINALLSKPLAGKPLVSDMIPFLNQVLIAYNQILDKGIEPLKKVLASPAANALTDQLEDPDFIFVVISALPVDELNALFLFIQQYFPEDLTVVNKRGNQLKVDSVFQNPSTDMNYLMEKVWIYFRLYHNANMPIIRAITKSKTAEFLGNVLRNSAILKQMLTTFQETLDLQFLTRKMVYSVFIQCLLPLYDLSSTTHAKLIF